MSSILYLEYFKIGTFKHINTEYIPQTSLSFEAHNQMPLHGFLNFPTDQLLNSIYANQVNNNVLIKLGLKHPLN